MKECSNRREDTENDSLVKTITIYVYLLYFPNSFSRKLWTANDEILFNMIFSNLRCITKVTYVMTIYYTSSISSSRAETNCGFQSIDESLPKY